MDPVVWNLLYSLIAMCGKGWLYEIAAESVPSEKLDPLNGRTERDMLSDVRIKKDHLCPGRGVESGQRVIDLPKERILGDKAAAAGPLLKALEDDVGYHGDNTGQPLSFLYHKTLKKVEGRPRAAENERIRVSPLNSETYERLDFPLSELNRFYEVGSLRAKNEDEQNCVDKLRDFLNGLLKKSETKYIQYKTNKHIGRRGAKLSKRWDGSGQQFLKNKSDFVKMLVATYPLQVSMFSGGLLKHYLDKSNPSGKYKPEQLVPRCSVDLPSYSSTNDAVDQIIDNVLKHGSEALAAVTSSRNLTCPNKNDSPSLVDSTYKVDTSRKAIVNQNVMEGIHQSAEDTVFKNALNELISDVPNDLAVSTGRPADAALEGSDKVKELETRIKSAKRAQETSTSNLKESPCMKIKVKNGPVTLTFQTHARKESPKRPIGEPSLVSGYKLNGDSPSLVHNSSTLLAPQSLLKNLIAGLTEESCSGGFGKNEIGTRNETSNYYSANDIETQSENYFLDFSVNRENNAKILNSFRPNEPFQTNTWNLTSPDEDIREVNKTGEIKTNSTEAAEPKLNLSQNEGTKNVTQPDRSSSANNTSERDVCNVIFPLKMIIDNYRSNAPLSSIAVKNRTLIPSVCYNFEPGLEPAKGLFISKTGPGGSYQITRYGDHSRPVWSLANHYDIDGTRNRYVPKLYYNELVVSKGLVGQHPPKLDTPGTSSLLSDSTLKKMETLNILKFYLDSLSSDKNYTMARSKDPYTYHNQMMKCNRKFAI